jgi:hypothetical protein
MAVTRPRNDRMRRADRRSHRLSVHHHGVGHVGLSLCGLIHSARAPQIQAAVQATIDGNPRVAETDAIPVPRPGLCPCSAHCPATGPVVGSVSAPARPMTTVDALVLSSAYRRTIGMSRSCRRASRRASRRRCRRGTAHRAGEHGGSVRTGRERPQGRRRPSAQGGRNTRGRPSVPRARQARTLVRD